ncbi:RICIN domain-containing protein [Amycolatopsis rifamycinica]|uniref:Ricin B lectin domain-containing protein n=1 Tax=Amycolatopsis rifamycinica TaxID=287986 RepID=A0A066TXZ3_9PSEU|nr:RICIN domain-containing protein [Amycolatopsis rifamycinica]KDN18457.1 hypothetical protein DV20_30220 [Amycolatopsis rifamycinica]
MRLINRFSGMAAEVPGGSETGGARVAQHHDRGGANQQWRLVPAGTVGGTATPTTSTTPRIGVATGRAPGSSTVLIGGSMNDASATAAPFEVRYNYVHSRPAASSDYYTAARCKPEWSSWWGCRTGETTAPGFSVTWGDQHAAQATYQGKARPQKYLWTWYSLRDLGDAAGQATVPARSSPSTGPTCSPAT